MTPPRTPSKKKRTVGVALPAGLKICDTIATGLSLRQSCKQAGVGLTMFFRGLAAHPELAERYARARETRGEVLADEIIAVADTANAENAYAVKVRVDARKWCAARMCRRVYGDAQSVEVSGTVQIDIADRLEQLRSARVVEVVPRRAELPAARTESGQNDE